MNNFTKSVVLLVLFIVQLIIIPGLHAISELKPPQLETTEPMVPAGPTAYRFINMSAAIGVGSYRRRLAPFQLCLLCKCCAGATCVSMPCCFGIDCQLPNKPFGVCAFVPKSCNCTNCATKN
ncbi:hypothetical protein F8388_018413 [Cannabis sativa]|uniref:DUF7866 domain-containing protein n=1 Tax=Cannabis sativa TaxID=3483 RepID=A0A7J6E7L3_CANSA|nr:hypothetical protein F8388_018413 [Cannabis sativa]